MTNSETTLEGLVERIDSLEMTVTHQDHVISELNRVIVEQWSKFDQVMRRMERLEDRIANGQDSAGQNAYDEPPPPHY